MKKAAPSPLKILVLHGPNLNLLGTREPGTYGRVTLAEINSNLAILAEKAGATLKAFQSNAEVELIEQVHGAIDEKIDFIIINPGAFTHTSIALTSIRAEG